MEIIKKDKSQIEGNNDRVSVLSSQIRNARSYCSFSPDMLKMTANLFRLKDETQDKIQLQQGTNNFIGLAKYLRYVAYLNLYNILINSIKFINHLKAQSLPFKTSPLWIKMKELSATIISGNKSMFIKSCELNLILKESEANNHGKRNIVC